LWGWRLVYVWEAYRWRPPWGRRELNRVSCELMEVGTAHRAVAPGQSRGTRAEPWHPVVGPGFLIGLSF